jgi:endogenous inhibitor of DNA gyrase (YacG/DUF329 family)
MNRIQKEKITQMRGEGASYSSISNKLNLSENTVKSYCRRNNLGGNAVHIVTIASGHCQQCGNQLSPSSQQKTKRFCSDQCRMKWWRIHPDIINKKAIYPMICSCCGIFFESYGNKNRKYCSRKCYGLSRRACHD